jgi:hypothetical protein
MRQTTRHAFVGVPAARLYASTAGLAALMMLLAACGTPGTAAASSARATATCPPARSFKTVTGSISATGANVITVTSSNGSKTLVHLTSTTRVTRILAAKPSDLTTGATVQVTTDTAVTAAQRIVIVPTGQGGFGGRGGGPGFGRGTPPAGFNSACFQRQGTPSGTGGTGGFQGLRGTVASASSTQVVLDDAQGQTFSVAITSATVILTSASGTARDLSVGLTVSASGTATSDGISARTITVQEAGAK